MGRMHSEFHHVNLNRTLNCDIKGKGARNVAEVFPGRRCAEYEKIKGRNSWCGRCECKETERAGSGEDRGTGGEKKKTKEEKERARRKIGCR